MGAAQYAETTLGADSSPYDGRRARARSATAVHDRRDANPQPHNELTDPHDAEPDPYAHTDDAHANSLPESHTHSGPDLDSNHSVTHPVTRFGGGLLCGGWCPGRLCGMGAR
ncbi:hypothetical protein GCM10009745_12640 [Kribbella yunnanensis]|uniref:Uncharacterized protein n=1 Tax=Kribbella yunnanensis TaxID=190194 RepID=A0ABN2GHM7_9ACTN